MAPLTFTYALDPAEQVRVSALVARRSGSARLWRLFAAPVLAAPLALAVILGWPLSLLAPSLLVLGLLGLLGLAAPAIRRWQAKRALAATPALSAALTYRLAREGISLDTAISSTQLAWDGVEQAEEAGDLFVLYFA